MIRYGFVIRHFLSCFFLMGFCHLSSGESQAQNVTARLFTGQAAAKADEIQGRRRRASASRSVSGSRPVLQLKTETVEGIISNSTSGDGLLGDYRSLNYLRTVDCIARSMGRDEAEEASATQRLLLYQSLKTIGEKIKNSPLDTYYRRTIAGIKSVAANTTFQVVKGGDGQIGVKRGEAPQQRFVEFKLHASVRDGLEPRVRLGDNLMLRFDPLRGDSLLEYSSDF